MLAQYLWIGELTLLSHILNQKWPAVQNVLSFVYAVEFWGCVLTSNAAVYDTHFVIGSKSKLH